MENTPAIPPPRNDETTSSSIRLREDASDPPVVKIERNRLDALTDWFVAGILGWLLYSNTLHGDLERGAAVIGLLAIAGVAGALKAFGKGGSAVVLLGAFAARPIAAWLGSGGIHRIGPWVVVPLALALSGCAGMEQRVADARSDAEETKRVLDQLGEVAAAVCSQPAVKDSDDCRELAHWYDRLKYLEDQAGLP